MIDQGWAPVKATEIVVDCPEQIVALPLIVAVGDGFILTTALPENVPVQLASLTAVTVYVVLAVGDTLNV